MRVMLPTTHLLLNTQMPHSYSCCVVAYLLYEVFSPLCQAFNCGINLTGSTGLSWLIYLTWLTVTLRSKRNCMRGLAVKHTLCPIWRFRSESDYPRVLQTAPLLDPSMCAEIKIQQLSLISSHFEGGICPSCQGKDLCQYFTSEV